MDIIHCFNPQPIYTNQYKNLTPTRKIPKYNTNKYTQEA